MDVDELGAGGVRLVRDGPHERRMLEAGADAENLAGLQIAAHLNGEARVCLEAIVCGGHEAERYSPPPKERLH